MSGGFIVASSRDQEVARELAAALGLECVDPARIDNVNLAGARIAQGADVGLLLSLAGAQDRAFVLLLQALAVRLTSADLILIDATARQAFAFLPPHWPAMSLADARARVAEMAREAPGAGSSEPVALGRTGGQGAAPAPPAAGAAAPAPREAIPEPEYERAITRGQDAQSPRPQAPAPARKRAKEDVDETRFQGEAPAASAPADATAFAPKKLRRGTPELIRIVIHQPKDLKAVIKAARRVDPRADAAPQSMGVGAIAFGAEIGVALEVKGALCDGALQRRTWDGAPLDFNFAAEAEADVKQAVILARVFIDDAQIGVLAFTRPIANTDAKPAPVGDGARLKRHKRVFLSYSSKDRETVAQIATAYQMAGVRHFWDRTSLKSGEQWGPRLKREIDACDLFHLCWSRQAAQSEWVEKEAAHALARQRRHNGKRPAITVQMLDGPPWAPHPPSLDSINFDDFVRAAIVGYARGERR